MNLVESCRTTQGLFDTVARHLLKQGAQAMDLNKTKCMYRTVDGLKCAVGCLIDDFNYNQSLEGGGLLFKTSVEKAVQRSIGRPLSAIEKLLLHDLQIVHDMASYFNKELEPLKVWWLRRLRGVAKKYSLKEDTLNE